jgi:hypothetical protein
MSVAGKMILVAVCYILARLRTLFRSCDPATVVATEIISVQLSCGILSGWLKIELRLCTAFAWSNHWRGLLNDGIAGSQVRSTAVTCGDLPQLATVRILRMRSGPIVLSSTSPARVLVASAACVWLGEPSLRPA